VQKSSDNSLSSGFFVVTIKGVVYCFFSLHDCVHASLGAI